jgi:Core-2/I-Branching enzyme
MSSVTYPPEDRPYLTVRHFHFCDILNGATFFTDLDLNMSGIAGKLDHSTSEVFAQSLDWRARQILAQEEFQGHFQRKTRFSESFTADSLKRGVCWNVAQGNLQMWRPYVYLDQHSEGQYAGRVLRTIDDAAAMPFLNYDGKQRSHITSAFANKPHYHLAYVLMVHSNSQNVAALIDALADPTVFIYIHVELFAPESFQQIRALVQTRTNVALMPTQFAVSWGNISLLWVEIRAFFDLLDLILFDYVINLSGADYPLKSAKTIYEHLGKKPNSNWVWWKADGAKIQADLNYRMYNMFHCRESEQEGKCMYTYPPQIQGYREFDGYKDLFPQFHKTSQWMVLHRSTVEYLRSSEAGKLFVMHMEHAAVPDEIFFATFLSSTPFASRTFRDPKRLMFWYGAEHPYEWTRDDESVIDSWESHFLWIRKVDVSADPELKELLDEVRRKDKMSNRIVLKYQEGIIPVD